MWRGGVDATHTAVCLPDPTEVEVGCVEWAELGHRCLLPPRVSPESQLHLTLLLQTPLKMTSTCFECSSHSDINVLLRSGFNGALMFDVF